MGRLTHIGIVSTPNGIRRELGVDGLPYRGVRTCMPGQCKCGYKPSRWRRLGAWVDAPLPRWACLLWGVWTGFCLGIAIEQFMAARSVAEAIQ